MKIGIFGDSFATNFIPEIEAESNTTASWVDIIAGKFETTNYARSGSSLYYSMTHFEKHQSKFDKLIFVITNPGRILLSTERYSGDKLINTSIAGIRHCENRLNRLKHELSNTHKSSPSHLHELTVMQAIMDYYLYVQNDEFDMYIQRLMIQQIKKIRPDTLLIPGARNSFADSVVIPTLIDIQIKENEFWEIQHHDLKKDIRHCHMTAENNAILAVKIEEWLNGVPVQINLDDFATPSNKEFYLK